MSIGTGTAQVPAPPPVQTPHGPTSPPAQASPVRYLSGISISRYRRPATVPPLPRRSPHLSVSESLDTSSSPGRPAVVRGLPSAPGACGTNWGDRGDKMGRVWGQAQRKRHDRDPIELALPRPPPSLPPARPSPPTAAAAVPPPRAGPWPSCRPPPPPCCRRTWAPPAASRVWAPPPTAPIGCGREDPASYWPYGTASRPRKRALPRPRSADALSLGVTSHF